MSTQIVKVPDIGGAEGVEVIEICVAVGDQVAREDSLVVLESDKASMEIPSPYDGTVTAMNIAEGDSLNEGDTILELSVNGVDNAQSQGSDKPAATTHAQTNAEVVAGGDGAEGTEKTAVTAPEPPAQPKAGASALTTETIAIPDIGGGEAEVIEVCVSSGEQVAEGDSLVVLETDKASMEVPSPKAGKVLSVTMKEGDTAVAGAAIVELEVAAGSATEQTAPAPQKPAKTAPASEQAATVAPGPQTGDASIPAPAFASQTPTDKTPGNDKTPRESAVYAGPAVRKLARELGVELSVVTGSGPKGRIAKSDLKAHVKKALQTKSTAAPGAAIAAMPSVDFSAFGDIALEPFNKIQKLTAANMQRNWLNIPHVTQFDDADISELENFRQSLKAEAEKRGVKITPLPFLLKACAVALKNHPRFNASLHSDGEHLVLKKYIHIGMAVDTPAGLVVPVIRDADKKSIWELAQECAELADKAKTRKLKPEQMQGGCFTISSLGGIGGQGFTPIVNAPEVAILGVSKLTVKPVWNGSEFVPRKMLPLALSYDHRAINGVDGGKFLTELTQLLADTRRLIL